MAQDFQQHKNKLYQQIQEQYGKLMYTYTCHLKMASILTKEANCFKWLQIILSAISSGGFIATIVLDEIKLAWIGGIVSTLLLVVSGYLKDRDYSSERNSHVNTASELWLLRESYISLLTDFNELSENEVQSYRDELIEKTACLYKSAPLTNEKAYKVAQDAIKNKQEQYFTQEELNTMLPAHLRKD